MWLTLPSLTAPTTLLLPCLRATRQRIRPRPRGQPGLAGANRSCKPINNAVMNDKFFFMMQPSQPEPHPAPLPTPHKVNGSMDPSINESVNPDLQFGGYNTQDMPQQTMYTEGLLPPPTGVTNTQPFPTPNNAPCQQAPPSEIANLPESEVTSQTIGKGDVLRSHTQQANVWKQLIQLWDKRELVDLKLK